MTGQALCLLLVLGLVGSGCEKLKSLPGTPATKTAPSAKSARTSKAEAGKKQTEAKRPLPFPEEQTQTILGKQEKISEESRDAFLSQHLSKSEEDDLYFEPRADESWTKFTPERR